MISSPASAQNQDAIEAMIRRGLSQRRDGHDAEAFQTFEAAWNLVPSARARAQMGLAAQALGRWADADRLLREALAATADPWIAERRAVLDRSLGEIDAHLGLLEVQCNIAGAVLRVDGTPRGTTPLRGPLRLPSGSVTLQVGAPGYLEVTRQAMLTTGQTTREQIDLVAVPAESAAPVAAAPTARPDALPPTPGAGDPSVTRPPAEVPPGSLPRTLAWTTGGVAVAGLALGAVFLGLRNAEANTFNARNADADPTNDCQRGSSERSCVDAEAAIATRGTVATTGFLLGGAAAIASAVLFATLPARVRPAHVGLRGCMVSTGRASLGVGCEITF